MSNHRLLVIDDAIIHRKILCRVGEKAGFDTTEAGSFDEAVQLLHDKEFDCITLDLSLGDRAGVEVLGLLSLKKCRAAIIIISGSEETIREDSLKIGNSLDLNICAPLTKPVDLSALRESLMRIAQQVGLRKLAGASA
jgi:CheY-like chemotaxis protein